MSQIRLTNQERITAIRGMGYTEREAQFMAMVALNGGYFIRRQYCDFLRKQVGGTAAALIEKAIANGHIKVSTFAKNTHVYHLATRPFYAALGQEDNRNRRERAPATIKNKLMGLDFVLSHSDYRYLATEQEKLDYFSSDLRIEKACLPVKLYLSRRGAQTTTRYFIDKYPIFVQKQGENDVPSFCFIDEGARTDSHFLTYLREYAQLFAALPTFQLIYVAVHQAPFENARKTFGRFVDGNRSDDRLTKRILSYFEARRLYEAKQLDSFDRAKLIRLRDDRDAFSGEKYEALYTRWLAGGTHAIQQSLTPNNRTQPTYKGTFATHLLEHNYEFFGNIEVF